MKGIEACMFVVNSVEPLVVASLALEDRAVHQLRRGVRGVYCGPGGSRGGEGGRRVLCRRGGRRSRGRSEGKTLCGGRGGEERDAVWPMRRGKRDGWTVSAG